MGNERPIVPPFTTYLGIESITRDQGRAEVELTLQEHHTNRRGVAHGGVVGAVLDSALGQAVVSSIPPEAWCATVSLSVQFVKGPRIGETIRATGEVVRRGRRVAFAQGEARNEEGEVLATAQGVWHLWDRFPGK